MSLQERLDGLEKRVMAKMDRAVQHCLAEQGLGPEAALPQVHARLQGVEDALQSVLAGRGSRADQRRSARTLKVGWWPLFNMDVRFRRTRCASNLQHACTVKDALQHMQAG